MIQTHIHHDGSASVHAISHPTLRGVRISAYLSPEGTLVDAEAYRSGGSGRPVRLSAAAREHALRTARTAVQLQQVLRRSRAEHPAPMTDEQATALAKQWREGLGSEQVTLWPGARDISGK